MSGHTPGPWALQLAEECTGRKLDEMVQWIVTANDHDIWISTGPTWDAEHSEESLANARLIAAAPELLAALEWMVAHDDTNEGNEPVESLGGQTWSEYNAYWLAGLEQARAAIAKAKGEPHA